MSEASLIKIFNKGGVIAYPTEAVFGLGCDPDNREAVAKILDIKNRPIEKGLILLAASYSQLLPYIDESLIPVDKRREILSRWPNGITQVLPKNKNTPSWLTGKFDTIAVRITDHPNVVELCNKVNKPIVSTSANLSGEEPAKTWQQLEENKALLARIDFIIKSDTLGFKQPSIIIDALTGKKFRE